VKSLPGMKVSRVWVVVLLLVAGASGAEESAELPLPPPPLVEADLGEPVRAPVTAVAPLPPPAPAPVASPSALPRLGPTATLNAAVATMTAGGADSAGGLNGSAKVGARLALLERGPANVSFTPTASLLATLEFAPFRQGLGLEGRLGAALARPLGGFFPFAELYLLFGGGFAGNGFRADSGWLRLGLGLQFNFYTLLRKEFGVGELVMLFFGAMGQYFQALGRMGNLGGLGRGGGGSAAIVCLLAVLFAIFVVPPLAIFAGMLVTMAGMVTNVELTWRPSLDGRTPAVTELRLGVGF
jgi:hypothetical protein